MISAVIDLAGRPPEVVSGSDFETELAALKADFALRFPDLAASLDSEAEPVVKQFEVIAARIVRARKDGDDQALSTFVQFATGAALDLIAFDRKLVRRVIVPAVPAAVPPKPAVLEPDDELRARCLDAFEALTTCGTPGAFRARCLEADGRVRDAVAVSPSPAVVDLYLLAREGDGAPDADLLSVVDSFIAPRRPVSVLVTVKPAEVVGYAIEAVLHLGEGPSAAVILAEAQAAVEALVLERHRFGLGISRSAIFAALHRAGGVLRVELVSPAADIECAEFEAAFCTGIEVSVA